MAGTTSNKIVKRLERWAKERRKWGAAQEEKILHDGPAALRKKDYLFFYAHSLPQAIWRPIGEALLLLINNKPEPAAEELARAIDRQMLLELMDPGEREPVGTCTLMMACGQWDLSRLLVQGLDERLAQPVSSFSGGDGSYPWEAAICALQRIKEGADPTDFADRREFGIYSQVFRFWNDSNSLAKILERCCDYHLAQYTTSSEKRVDSMGANFWSLGWPLELLAIWQLRNSQGLEMPPFSHELVDDNPLYFLYPTELPSVEDPIVAMLEGSKFTRAAFRKKAAKVNLPPLPGPPPRKKVTMKQFEIWLLENTDDSLQEAVTADFAFFVGHRDWSEDLFNQVQAYFGYDDDFRHRFQFRGPAKGSFWVSLDGQQAEEKIGRVRNPYGNAMAMLNKVLQPASVAKGFAFTRGSDSHFYCILPADWFESFSRRHPKTAEYCFVDCESMK